MLKVTREQIEQTIKQMTDYKWFEKGDYNLNIVGIRNSNTKGKVTNLSKTGSSGTSPIN